MSDYTFKPGDVAWVAYRSKPGGTLFGTAEDPVVPGTYVAVVVPGVDGPIFRTATRDVSVARRDVCSEARPLVALDPKGIVDFPSRLIGDLLVASANIVEGSGGVTKEVLLLRAIAERFDAVFPRRPDEPQGLGAVVESETGDLYVRDKVTTTHAHWKRAAGKDGGRRYRYMDIRPTKVLSEGWRE